MDGRSLSVETDRFGQRRVRMGRGRCIEALVQRVGHGTVWGVGYINKRNGVRCQLSYEHRSSVGAD